VVQSYRILLIAPRTSLPPKWAWGFRRQLRCLPGAKLDATERTVASPSAAALLVGAVAPVGVAYYFIATMRFPLAVVAMLKALLFFIGLSLVFSLAEFLSGGAVI
jgi:hypothetical protein